MSPASEFPRSNKAEIYARLSQGEAVGVTVVTPTRRLALALKREFDRAQCARGLVVWDSADILPWPAFVERAYEDLLYSERASEAPILLGPAQEQALWENIIRNSEAGAQLLAVPETARLAREAWQLSHAWQLTPRLRDFPLSEDSKAFVSWSQRYERDTKRERWTEGARLAGLITAWCKGSAIQKPKSLVCYGFDIISPQQEALFAALHATGCKVSFAQPQPRNARALRIACKDGREEMQRAATWARARLEANGAASIGVVVPELAAQRSAIVRAFSTIMAPDYALPDAVSRVLPFNVSLGTPLSTYPLVHTALFALELAGREIDFERLSLLLRSPFLAGAETELAPRARLDARLRKRAEPVVTLDRLLTLMAREGAGCPILMRSCAALGEFRKSRLFAVQTPSALAKAISEALALAGFPGERGLDSSEYQTLKKWHEVLADFATLDAVVPRIGYNEGLSRLRGVAADTLFQPETPEVPVQILGVLEAAGMEFDHLWVMGLTDEAWPQSPRPNPLLPIEVQRACGLPHASAAASLEVARRITAGWRSSAEELVLSYPQREDDRALKPSPLIVAVAEKTLPLPVYTRYRDLIHHAGVRERILDSTAPLLDTSVALIAGTQVIRDQAACPFRAYALHRLAAEGLEAPHTGLDAIERGELVHRVLAQTWTHLKTRAALDASGESDLGVVLTQAAQAAIARIKRDRPTTLSGRFAALEQERLVRLARKWLEYEKARGDFTVVAIEDRRCLEIGGLSFNARLDRVDETDDGRRIVIDYKTGKPSASSMLGERPEEPQLPLYLAVAEPAAACAAFGQVTAGDMRFVGLARDGDLLPAIKPLAQSHYHDRYGSWPEMVEAWRSDLTRLARSFAAGEAAVDPKQYPHTCRYCEVQPFCRIYERLHNALDADSE